MDEPVRKEPRDALSMRMRELQAHVPEAAPGWDEARARDVWTAQIGRASRRERV